MEKTTLYQATSFRKNGKYKEAYQIYERIYSTSLGELSKWDKWGYAFSCFKSGNETKALNLCREFYPEYKDFEPIKTLYARAIYTTELKNTTNSDLEVKKKAVKAILKLSNPGDQYSYAPLAVFALSKTLMKQKIIKWSEIDDWLQMIHPEDLQNRPFVFEDPKGKKHELASPLEQWYAFMVKSLAGQGKNTELLNLLQIIREKKIKWHYDNNFWFARKEAFAWLQLGNRKNAEKILRKLVTQKNDWFLLFDLANTIDDPDEKIELLARAALKPGKMEMKLKLFYQLFLALKDSETDRKNALLHLSLIATIRQEQNWPWDQEINQLLVTEGIIPPPKETSFSIAGKLKLFWKEKASQLIERETGTILSFISNGHAGFIKSDKGNYFFLRKAIKGDIKLNDPVTFEIIEGYDGRKNKKSKKAINIKKVN